jgi:signal transduction histidine kinase
MPVPDTLPQDYASDVAAIQKIDVVPTILEVVCRTTGMGFAAVARVTEERWVACAVRDEINFGLPAGGELEIRSTICNEIRQTGQLVVIDDVQCDDVFREHHTPKRYGFRSYISVPINLPSGRMFGTLCAIDPRPARLTDARTVDTFKLFADLIGLHLDAHDRLKASTAELATAQERADLQHQFVAVLSHDLRNPLSAAQTASKMLLAMGLDPHAQRLAGVIDRSVARMTSLIDNVMDFARVRLGGGLTVARRDEENLAGLLEHVVTELRTTQPHRQIESDMRLTGAVYCDAARLGQLLSNLASNALTHGDPDGPVRIRASNQDGFVLAVTNAGKPISQETLRRLFLPFVRGSDRSGSQGLGLGLYIASEIARAHGGTLNATTTGTETTFTFRM